MADINKSYDLLKEIFLLIDEGDQQLFKQHGLSVVRYYTLYHLHKRAGSTLRELTDKLLCDKSNVTRIVKTLEKAGLIIRRPNAEDGRSSRLYLTESGAILQSAVATEHLALNQARFIELNQKHNVLDQLGVLKETLSAELLTSKHNSSQ